MPPPRWGGNNATLAWSASVAMTDPSDAPLHPTWDFEYYYDWNKKASRYEHAAGQHDEVCSGSGPAGDACTVLNSADGNMYLLYPRVKTCCVCHCSFCPFTVRSDWLQDGGTSYQGRSTVSGVEADEWLKQGASDNHYYATTDATQAPVRYMEHKNGKLKQWDFKTYSPKAPAASLFDTPADCTDKCKSSVCH